MLKKGKLVIFRVIQLLRLYPSIYWIKNPFKIIEFNELTKNLKKNPKSKILDLGSGFGLQTVLLRKWAGIVIGIDPYLKEENYILHNCYKRTIFLKKKLEDTKLEDETLNEIFSFSVIEHISNYKEILKKCYSLLKSGGNLIFSCDSLEAVNEKKLIKKHKKEHNVEKYFRKNDLESLLEELGFREISIYPIFTSFYAKKLFIDSIEKRFKFGFIESLVKYKRLERAEKTNHSETKGLFLVVFGKKP